MHALLVDLWPWLIAFYLVDGLAQLQRGHLLLASSGLRFAAVGAGLHLRGLSPLAEGIALHDLPFLVAGDALLIFDPRSKADPAVVEELDLQAMPLASLGPLTREGRKVSAGGRLLLVAPTPGQAELARARIGALSAGAASPAPSRGEADLVPIRSLRAAQGPWAAALRVAACLLALATGAAWPLVAYGPPGLAGLAGALLAAVAALLLVVAGLAYAMWRACGEPRAASAASALHLLTFPVAAIHPLWHASRPLYGRFHPLAVAAALLPPEDFAPLAGRELRRAELSRAATRPGLAAAWAERIGLIERLLAGAGLSRAAALAPPPRYAGSAAWCPLCRVQWRDGFARCDDCGVELERFDGGPRLA